MKNNWLQYNWVHGNRASVNFAIKHINEHELSSNALSTLAIVKFTKQQGLLSKIKAFTFFNNYQNNNNKIINFFTWPEYKPVGFRYVEDAFIAYIYCVDESITDKIQKYAKNNGLNYLINFCFDNKYEQFKQNVYPTMAQYQTIRNCEAVDLRKKRNDSINLARRINHYCSFYDEVNCFEFNQRAKEAGFAIMDLSYSDEQERSCITCVCNVSSLALNELNEATTKLCSIAEKYDGKYENWNCKLILNR